MGLFKKALKVVKEVGLMAAPPEALVALALAKEVERKEVKYMDKIDEARFVRRLQAKEGNKRFAYTDTTGNLSIGIGRNLTAKGLSEDERLYLLNNDLKETYASLDKYLPWWRELDGVRQIVLAEMCFNMGIAKLNGFHNTLAAIQRGDWAAAKVGMLNSLWARQVKGRAVELAEMMLTGAWPEGQ